eukprot:3730805-Prymnesium_polylepis.1
MVTRAASIRSAPTTERPTSTVRVSMTSPPTIESILASESPLSLGFASMVQLMRWSSASWTRSRPTRRTFEMRTGGAPDTTFRI